VKFLCEQCKAKYQIADEKAVGKTVRMKCRKCGHLIEVRAAVTETSVASNLAERAPVPAPPPSAPGPAVAAPPGVTSALAPSPGEPAPPASATLIAAAPVIAPVKPAPRPERPPSALEGAFKTAVQSSQHDAPAAPAPARPAGREDEQSTPFDMADLSPSDEWYVAINGVPVGPIRVAEVRRKAALGAVTEDSLVWQEGLDEWRPLRTFPELAASVREAMTRLSRPPPGEVRLSAPPPPPARSLRSTGAPLPQPALRAPPPRSSLGPASQPLPAPQAAAARSNVVPIMSRLATAEKLEPALVQRTSPVPGPPTPPPELIVAESVPPSIVPDPFAGGPVGASMSIPAAPGVPVFAPVGVMSSAPPSAKPVSWMGWAFVAMASFFGITAALAMVDQLLLKRPPSTVTDTTSATSSAPAPGVPSATPTAAAPTTTEAVERPTPAATATATHAPTTRSAPAGTATAATAATPTATGTGRSLDLHSLTQSGGNVTPTDEPGGSDVPKSTGSGSLTEGQITQVVGLHRPGVSRGCWDRNPTAKAAVNVTVTLTVAADGSAQNVSASGDDPSVAKCIENDVRNWKFPASGSSQKIVLPFKFVRQ
jgi:predicted Zn finger-like uncharacterized protein